MALQSLTATFSVDTKHGDKLEFVLSDGDRDQYDYYEGKLWAMLCESLRGSGGVVDGCSHYGDVLFTIEFTNIEDLPIISTIFENTVKHWCVKWGINKMKTS